MKIVKLLCIFCLIISVYLFSALVLIFNPLFYEEISANTSPAKQVTSAFIDYLRSPSFEDSRIQILTEKENSHLRDVKIIIFRLELLLVAVLIILFVCRSNITAHVLLASGAAVVMLPFLSFIIPFDALFVQFHYVFFPQGNWQFDPTSTTLVNIYPEEFFQKFFFKIVVHSILFGSVLAAAYCQEPPVMS